MSYLGSKGQAGVFQRIIGNMPPHSLYVEPFAGSAKIFFTKRRAATSVLIDASGSQIEKLSEAVSESDQPVHTFHMSALHYLTDIVMSGPRGQFRPDTLIYCDPPYLHSTRTSRHRYTHEMTDADHARLLALLKDLECRVMISGYPSALYAHELRDWRCISYRTRTRGRTVTECLWCNFPEPEELHDGRFAGRNFRERLRLKRMAARWLARLDAMPARERGYLLNAVHQR